MKLNILLPHRFKTAGWIILIPSLILGLITYLYEVELKGITFAILNDNFLTNSEKGLIETNILPTLCGILIIVGALFICFSEEKNEDEYINSIRQNALSWAVIINYVLIILSFLFIYGIPFLYVMLYNLFTILFIFILRYYYLLYKIKKEIS